MKFWALSTVAAISLMSLAAAFAQPKPRTRATATIAVQSSHAQPFDDRVAGPKLTEINLVERFTGDINAESTVRALQVQRPDGSADLVSLQRVDGTIAGRHGAFVLQGRETAAGGKVKATWSVVPGSGTGGLAGLRGDGGFAGAFGKGSTGTLDYWFQ